MNHAPSALGTPGAKGAFGRHHKAFVDRTIERERDMSFTLTATLAGRRAIVDGDMRYEMMVSACHRLISVRGG